MTSVGRYISAFFVIVLVSLLVACGASTPTPLSVVTVSSLPTAVAGSSYSATLQAKSGTPPYTWAITSGSLPSGLTLNSSTGLISGTPTVPDAATHRTRTAANLAPATDSFTVTVTDSSTPTPKSASASMQIVVNPPLALTTTSLPAGVVGTGYNQTLAATGGLTPYTWSVTIGNLPAGLSLNTSTGAITGTPTGPFVGTTSFTVMATDSESPTKSATASLSIAISAPTLTVTTTSLTGGTLGTAYSQGLTATGGVAPYSWAVTIGSLPTGLTLNTSTGQITGTPTGNVTGPINFGVTVTDSETPTTQASEANLSITITAPPLSVTTSSLPTGVVQSAYTGATLQATGGVSPYSWAVTTGTLPAGLSLNSSTGAISGTPTTSGTSPITVTVTDSESPNAKTASANLSVVVNPKLAVSTSSLGAAVVGTAYNQTLAATGGITPYSWAVTTGSLPAGLSLNSSTGAITGTPTGPQVGTINFTVTVTDSESPTKTATANLGITVSAPPLSVTTQTLAAGTLGTAYVAAVAATGGIAPYSWSISGGSLPAGLSLNSSTGAITGTPSGNVTGAINFTVKVTDSEQPTAATATAALSINISATPLSVTTSSLPTGVAQSAYPGASLQATGGVSPYFWSVTSGSLPAGLSLNSSTGAISGTATASGTASFTVTATDSETPTPQTATKNLSITINPQLAVTTSSLAAASVGTSYNQALAASGGITPYSWSVTSGSLPAGLSLNTSTGAITGTPTGPQVGTISFTVTVTDSESPTKTASANLGITVSAPALSVTTSSLAAGSLGNAYSATVAATGGITPYAWSISAGNLPAGLTINSSTGVISGTPTGSVTGAINFTVKVTDSEQPAGTATAALSINISASPLSVVTSSLPNGVAQSTYAGATLQAAGGVSPYFWSVTTGSLPGGLSLNSSTGAISGTPTTAGPSNFTVTVTDSETPTAQTATKNLSITINPQLAVTTSSLAPASVGTAYSQTLAATGGITPYSWSITSGSLPAGLSLNTSTGAISGTPTGPLVGLVSFTATVTDSESPTKTASANLGITVSAPPLSITTSALAGGTLGTAYSTSVAATGGIAPYTWSISAGNLPAGLSLNSSTGAISGTPTGSVTGPINFTVKVTDAEQPTGATATAALSITITAAPLSVVTSSLPSGVAQSTYAGATLQAAGGVSPYSWAVTTGSLPAGLSLNSSTGAISGTPTAAGTTTFTVTVTDSETPTPQTATKQLSITVNPQLSVTTSSLTAGVVGTAYSQTLAATGGLTPYSWSITTGSLPSGLSLNSSTGAITGTPTGPLVGTISFTVTVTDSENPVKTATANLSIAISVQTLTVTSTGALPSGVYHQAYSTTLTATGGIAPYTWSITSGTLPAGLTLNSSTGQISGTANALGMKSFTIKVTDSEQPTPMSATASASIAINNASPLQIITSALSTGVVGNAYSDQFSATGGVMPYNWTISAGSLPPGLSVAPSTGQITGTPTQVGTTNFTVKVTDSSSPTQSVTANLSITVNTGLTITTTSVPNGNVGENYSSTISAAGGVEPYTWSILSGNLPPGLNANNNNDSLSISGQPTTAGTYNFTVQVTDSETFPASVNANFTIVINSLPVGYTVSGTVSYSGSKTGQVYLQLTNSNCSGCNNNQGTSISNTVLTSGGGAFTIHGVLPGTYTLQAYMDNVGYGAQNASNPTGSASNVTVVNSNVTGVGVTLTDPGTVTLGSGPSWKGGNNPVGFSGGAFVTFSGIQNNNGIEMPTSYTVQWSTSSTFGSVTGTKSFPATGSNNPWIVSGIASGTYYFRAQGVAGSSTSSWSSASPAITVAAPTGNAVSGKVTFTQTATGPLYVGFYDQNTGYVYATVVGSHASPPTSPASYSVNVPTGTNYYFFAVLDQGNSGLLSGPGQVSNVNSNSASTVAITGTTTNENLTLPSGNSIAVVLTQSSEQINSGNTTTTYSLGFNVNGLVKLPVAVELATGPTGAVIPADIATNAFNGSADRFSYWTSLNGATPQVNDSYILNVTYSDGTSEILTVKVGAVLNAFATNLAPQGSSVSVTPNFSWTDPANASSYTYQFYLCCDSNGTIWQIPGNNSNSNGFSSSITSITWNVDPLNSGNLPNISSLAGNTMYNWQIQATDVNGNSAQVQVNFTTAPVPLTLPAAGSVGSVTVGQNFNGAVNASGGVGPYSFTVNGSAVPTDGTQVSLGDSLFASNTGGNTLSLSGTPSSITTVSFTVAVTDSASGSAGPDTYTITVNPVTPLTLQTTAMPGGDKSWQYSAVLKANGGVQPYTWSVSSGSLPAGLSISTSGNNNGIISGTPTATGTASFTVEVTDSASDTATASLSITIGDCANNASLSGNYAFMANGWKNSSDASSEIGSFVANGSGSITSGVLDISDQVNGPKNKTLSGGTYCVSSNNLVAINLVPSGGGGSATFEATLDSTGNGHIIRYDSTSAEISAGLLRKQTTSAFSTASINGNYAFGLAGADQGSNRFGMAGEFNSNGSGTLSGQVDYDDGNPSSPTAGNTTMTASDFTVGSSTTGRGTVTINFTGQPAVNFAFYVVSSSEALLMAIDTQTTPMILAGQVLKQSSSLTNASLTGNSVIELQGLDTSGGSPVSDLQAGILDASGTGTFTLTLDENDGGTFDSGTGTPQSLSGDYAVGTGGRVTLSNITGCSGGCGGHSPIFYLVGTNQAFVISTGGEASFGTITPQTGSNFTNASLNGNFLGGSQQPVNTNVSVEVDQVHADGNGNFTANSDKNNYSCGSGNGCPEASSQALTYSVSSNGRVQVSQDGQVGVILYIISGSQAVILSTSDSNAALEDFHQ